ncbi:MAG: lamin tail domain-containing protein [Bacteroides sp.]|nr:lamin tail domain-containing protein [Bacteroides sp.]
MFFLTNCYLPESELSDEEFSSDPVQPVPEGVTELSSGALLFNEIMFHPKPSGQEYMELYNNSGQNIDIRGMILRKKREDGSYMTGSWLLAGEESVFAAASYLCFTANRETVIQQYDAPAECVVEVPGLSALNNSSGILVLLSAEGEVIDEVSYTVKMHTTLQSDKSGISLEKRHPALSSGDPDNWRSAAEDYGYATPGRENSIHTESGSASDQPEFRLESTRFNPWQGERLLLHFQLPGDGYLVRAVVYDITGVTVCKLYHNHSVGTSGTLSWDGKSTQGKIQLSGSYILL